MINDDFAKYENDKRDEYIRLDTTIIGIDNLIAKASTAEEANALFKAKDVIYSQQQNEQKVLDEARHADELLETIEEFEEEAQPDGGWISVKDRLPPYGERVLVINEAYETERGYTKYNCGVTVRDPHLDFTFWGHKVTHWQPLPEPPKGE